MLVYSNHQNSQLVSVLFQNQLSEDISHAILFENEAPFQQLIGGSFQTSRDGSDLFLKITSETELLQIRQITKIPLFIKF